MPPPKLRLHVLSTPLTSPQPPLLTVSYSKNVHATEVAGWEYSFQRVRLFWLLQTQSAVPQTAACAPWWHTTPEHPFSETVKVYLASSAIHWTVSHCAWSSNPHRSTFQPATAAVKKKKKKKKSCCSWERAARDITCIYRGPYGWAQGRLQNQHNIWSYSAFKRPISEIFTAP